jgi:hypothetical protein
VAATVLDQCGFWHRGEVVDPEDGLVWRWEKYEEADGGGVGLLLIGPGRTGV